MWKISLASNYRHLYCNIYRMTRSVTHTFQPHDNHSAYSIGCWLFAKWWFGDRRTPLFSFRSCSWTMSFDSFDDQVEFLEVARLSILIYRNFFGSDTNKQSFLIKVWKKVTCDWRDAGDYPAKKSKRRQWLFIFGLICLSPIKIVLPIKGNKAIF